MHSLHAGNAPEALPEARGPMRLVSSLRYRDWRLLWSGLMAAQAGEWMDNIAINWLVWVQTSSPLALGTVSLVRGLPIMLFSLAGGVVADRLDRRALMIWTQAAGLAATAGIAALATADALQLWQLYGLLVLRGISIAFNSPARSSVIGDLVPRSDVTNALALHSAVFNSTRMVGPAIAGVLIGAAGGGAAGGALVLWLHVVAYAIAIWTLLAMNVPPSFATRGGASAWSTFVDGIVYIRREPVVLMLMLTGIVPFLLGQPYQSMLPVFATDVFFIGPEGLGFLTSAAAIGSLIAAFAITGLGDFSRKGLVMVAGLVGFGLFIMAFALTPWAPLAAALLFIASASHQLYATTNSTLVQLIVPSEYRGRIMGVHQLDRGFIPIGSFLLGALAQWGGAQAATAVMAGSLTLVALAVLVLVPAMRRLE